uniref:Thyroglobulin type-1 domain-containing protein n=1 Tax=Stegastes partitus TaxID=144197 RepID=A0A3B5B765_9TELE
SPDTLHLDPLHRTGFGLNATSQRSSVRRSVCGSNGRLYKSLCSFQRAQCINTQLRLAPQTHCSGTDHRRAAPAVPVVTKCQLARAQAVEARGLSSSSSFGPAAAIFVPECSSEGHFLPTQCHNQTGYCWCSTPDGKPLSGTTVLHQVPDCSGQTSVTATTTTTTYTTNTTITTTTTTSSTITTTTTLTAPPFWVTILMNSEPKGNRSVRRPTGESTPLTCERERSSLLSQIRPAWQDERFIPECTADGRYSSVQCHAATGYCWCVRADSGRPLPGTSMLVHGVCSPSTGCPGARKKQFLKSLVRALQASDSPPSTSPSSDPPPSPSSSPLGASAAPEAEDSSGPEAVLRWHFGQLDVDSSGVLSEREARPLRQFLRRRLKPRRCAKKFAQYCDRDGDRGLTIEELRVCLDL